MTIKMRFLIVDDTPRTCQSMKALLKAWDPKDEILAANNGAEALQLTEKFQPDIILMDALMPAVNGLEATQHIKSKWPSIKIIVMSVFPEFQERAQEVGADGFLCKSDPPEELRKLLAMIFQKE
jgi:CheY-like chemotaxis protein